MMNELTQLFIFPIFRCVYFILEAVFGGASLLAVCLFWWTEREGREGRGGCWSLSQRITVKLPSHLFRLTTFKKNVGFSVL
ncbi:hypothetical protein AOLI_G00010120 [Acnodon oligacanthus]